MTIQTTNLSRVFNIDLRSTNILTQTSSIASAYSTKVHNESLAGDAYTTSKSFAILERTLNANLSKPVDASFNTQGESPVREIAKNILTAVRQELREARSNGAGEQELQDIINQAYEGVKKGFSEAKDVLQGRFENEPRLERQIDRAFNRVLRGLERIDNRFTPSVESFENKKNNLSGQLVEKKTSPVYADFLIQQANDQPKQVEFSKIRNVEKLRSFELSIQTQEGDTINVNVQKSLSKQVTKQAELSEEGFSATYSKEVQRDKQVSYEVAGNISDAEQTAINALLKKVNRLADKFFDGNVINAFKKATRIGIDSEQLANFSLNVQSTRTVEVTKTYREVQGISPTQQTQSPVETLGEFVGGVAEIVSQPEVSDVVADAVPVTTELFKQVAIRDERYAQLAIEQNVEVVDQAIDGVSALAESLLMQAA